MLRRRLTKSFKKIKMILKSETIISADLVAETEVIEY
jgi:hypothetical protein